MIKLLTFLVFTLGIALVVSLTLRRTSERELQQQILEMADANKILRNTLGEMTIAIAENQKEIDRLYQSPCAETKDLPGSPKSLPHLAEAPAGHNHRLHPGVTREMSELPARTRKNAR